MSTLFRPLSFLSTPESHTARRGIRTVPPRGRLERSINRAKGPAAQDPGLIVPCPGKGGIYLSPMRFNSITKKITGGARSSSARNSISRKPIPNS